VRVKKEGVRLIYYIKEPSLNNRVHAHLLWYNGRQLGQALRTFSNSSCVPIKRPGEFSGFHPGVPPH